MTIASNAPAILDREFLFIRSKLLDAAAAMDRVERAGGSPAGDPRWNAIRQAVEALGDAGPTRAERVLMIFSLPYEEDWRQGFDL